MFGLWASESRIDGQRTKASWGITVSYISLDLPLLGKKDVGRSVWRRRAVSFHFASHQAATPTLDYPEACTLRANHKPSSALSYFGQASIASYMTTTPFFGSVGAGNPTNTHERATFARLMLCVVSVLLCYFKTAGRARDGFC